MKLHSEIEKSTENTKKIIAKTRKNIEKKSTPYDPNFTYNQILSISATGTAEVKISQLKA